MTIVGIERLARAFEATGISLAAFEQAGHGRSSGPPGCVRSLDALRSDTLAFIALVHSKQPQLPLILIGHSMGGALCLVLADQLRTTYGPLFRGLVLLSPFVKLHAKDELGCCDAWLLACVNGMGCGGSALGPTITTETDFGKANKAINCAVFA